jgi:transcriptional regulator with XRE-family HTH domain
MELAELREALQVSQEELASKLKVTQAAISRLERRPNVLLESLANYVSALGGRIEVHAVLPSEPDCQAHACAGGHRKEKERACASQESLVREMSSRSPSSQSSRTRSRRLRTSVGDLLSLFGRVAGLSLGRGRVPRLGFQTGSRTLFLCLLLMIADFDLFRPALSCSKETTSTLSSHRRCYAEFRASNL